MTLSRVLGQKVLDGLLHSDPAQRVRWKSLTSARSMLIRLRDPNVRIVLDGHDLELPLSHDLPLIRREHPGYLTNLGRVASLVGAKYPEHPAIDIGANVGDTAVIIRAAADVPILCIEGDPRFGELLERNLSGVPRVRIERSFVDVSAGTKRVNIQTSRGTTTLAPDQSGTEVDFTTLSAIVAADPSFAEPALIKTDLDGWDGALLSAEAPLLERAKPTLFFEYDPRAAHAATGRDPTEVFDVLGRVGYTTLAIYGNTGTYLTGGGPTEELIRDIHRLCRASDAGYCDLAAFHSRDEDLFDLVHARD